MTNYVAKFVADSDNQKISPKEHKVSATYVSIKASCPNTCTLRSEGSCYAFGGPVAILMRNLDKEVNQTHNPNMVAMQEAELIEASFKGNKIPQDGAKGGRDLRLHVFGDATTPFAATRLGQAAANWVARSGGTVWTYTHAWQNVNRHSWGKNVSILASIDVAEQAQAAIAQGYAPARIVPEHKDGKMFLEHGVKWIPCPEQVNDVKCTKCRLCLNADKLLEKGMGISFSAHGSGTKKIKKRLTII